MLNHRSQIQILRCPNLSEIFETQFESGYSISLPLVFSIVELYIESVEAVTVIKHESELRDSGEVAARGVGARGDGGAEERRALSWKYDRVRG